MKQYFFCKDKMCWNAPVSLASFITGLLISFGIGITAIRQKKPELAVLSFGWSWVICMQLFEYFIWTNPTDNSIYARWAYVFNITQVLVLGLLFLAFFEHPKQNKIIACGILFLYSCYMFYYAQDVITSVSQKKHLQYNWWSQLPYGGIIYILTLCSVFLLLVRPSGWSIRTLAIILLLLWISAIFYSDCLASLWCFFAISVPVISFIMY
jgi:hypothetical protein